MDHSVSPDLDRKLDDAARAISQLGDTTMRRHMLQDLLNRLGFKAIVVVPPVDFDEVQTAAVYKAIQASIRALAEGMTALAVMGQRDTGHRWEDIGSPDPTCFREDIVLLPEGCSFRSVSLGPFDLHLPTWVDPHMTCEIAGTLWRVLRFCLSGYAVSADDAEFNRAVEEALKPNGKAHLAPQYAALGYMRWLLGTAGIRTYDYFGNEVSSAPEFFYGDLFTKPENMPKELVERAAHVSAMNVTVGERK